MTRNPNPDMIRLLITIPNFDTNGQRHLAANLIRELDKSLFQITVCVYKKTDTTLENEIKTLVYEIIEIPLRIPIRPINSFLQHTKQISKLFKEHFDIIHSFDYSSNWVEGFIAKRSGIPWVFVKTNMNNQNLRWWIKYLFANKIVFLSESQKRTVPKLILLLKETTVINPGIDLNVFNKSSENKFDLRNNFYLPDNKILLACVAELTPVKGHIELLETHFQKLLWTFQAHIS
jgi:glycosyltransferase involved in cell wall biosynthesis